MLAPPPSSINTNGVASIAMCDTPQPVRRVVPVRSADHHYAKVGDGKQRTANPPGRDPPMIQTRPFNDEKRTAEIVPKTGNLRPESSVRDGAMKIRDGLPLDSHTTTDDVVRQRQVSDLEARTEPLKRTDDDRRPLTMVNQYRQYLTGHTGMMVANLSQDCVNCSTRCLSRQRETPHAGDHA